MDNAPVNPPQMQMISSASIAAKYKSKYEIHCK